MIHIPGLTGDEMNRDMAGNVLFILVGSCLFFTVIYIKFWRSEILAIIGVIVLASLAALLNDG